MNNDILKLEGIYKSFPGVQALEDVDFSLKKGEIHTLVGENGAGKSTLIKVITGVEHHDKGCIMLRGEEINIKSPQHAQTLGISTVYQEVNLCDNLTVAENILIGREPRKFARIDWKAMNQRAKLILERLEVDIDVTRPLAEYSTAIQQIIAIARALEIASADVLILDEPTSSLDENETQKLFKIMRKLKSEGVGIVFITHFISQIYEVSDRTTVLRNGKLIGTYDTKALSRIELITKMIGRSLVDFDELAKNKYYSSQIIKSDESVMNAKELGRHGSIKPFDLELHAGEVTGLTGLLGSGRTEIAQLLFGIEKPDNGSIEMDGEPVKNFSPHGSLERGVALCPEDRKGEGILGELTIRENIVIALQARLGWFKFLQLRKQYEIADKYIKMLNISTPSPDQLVKNLSGGNQQKVILARWLATHPKVLILDEPTRGIDVGTKAEIQKLVLSLAEEGMACVFISSELEETLRTCHKIVVLREREKVTEYDGKVDENVLMHAIAGS
ncbi:MAG: sugar ABC transporter ATP-binding protein [Anaerolineaceae bacterium]|nr:sugar ABC transporter ATP-binding protein [Anaerolineaceae bacterium]